MAPGASKSKRVFSASSRAGAAPLWAEVWANRSILWLLTRRELKARYAGSMLGVMWNVIHPIVMIMIYILILGPIMKSKIGGGVGTGVYVVHLCAGIIPWLVFQEIVTRCAATILENAGFIKKVAFPEVILHLTAVLNSLFVHAISYTAFILILLVVGPFPGARVLACFGILAAIAVFALGVGLVISVLNIYFRDVGQLVSIGLQVLFWFVPIVYFPSLLTGPGAGSFAHRLVRLMEWNPLLHFVRMSQWLFGDNPQEAWFSWSSLGVVVLAPVAALWLGLKVFNHFKRDVLDNI
jgi:lipopolysaccharide transport system permease protein